MIVNTLHKGDNQDDDDDDDDDDDNNNNNNLYMTQPIFLRLINVFKGFASRSVQLHFQGN